MIWASLGVRAVPQSGKRWIVSAIGAAFVAVLAYAVFELLLVAVVSAVVASLVTLIGYRYLERRSKPEPPARPSPKEGLISMLDGLLDLNIQLREQAPPRLVVERIERLIDQLRGLLDDLNLRHPDHELTWTVNQMARKYLPKIVGPYLALSSADRNAARDELMRSLDGLEAEIANVADLVNSDKMGDFKAKAAFLRARFVQGL